MNSFFAPTGSTSAVSVKETGLILQDLSKLRQSAKESQTTVDDALSRRAAALKRMRVLVSVASLMGTAIGIGVALYVMRER